jgi:hypothetical protein
MRSLEAVQGQCQECSTKQAIEMRKYSMEQRKKLQRKQGLKNDRRQEFED